MDVNPIELQKYLKGADYPARPDALVETARANGAPDEIVETLRGLGDGELSGPDEVMKRLS